MSLEERLGASALDLSLALSGSPLSIANVRIGELRDVSHSKGDAGNSSLHFGKAQRVSPRTTVYRLPKKFALVIPSIQVNNYCNIQKSSHNVTIPLRLQIGYGMTQGCHGVMD